MSTRRLVTLLLGLSFACGATAGAAAEPGVLVRLYDVGEDMRWLPDIAAGQLPNVVKVVPTIDLRSERKEFAPLERNFVTEVVGRYPSIPLLIPPLPACHRPPVVSQRRN